jgi:hypothetical protein
MSWITKLIGAPSVGETIEATGNALNGLFTSDDERLTHAEVMERIKQNPNRWQTVINLAEAGHRSIFVAGWRPAIGWVCALSLANWFLVNPWIQWITGKTGPEIQWEVLMQLVVALLGLAGLRTTEKKSGVAK